MATSNFRMSYPAARGEMVLQGHADACAEFGHAAWVIDGVTQPRCPRCGETTATEEEIEAYVTLLKATAAAEAEERRIKELMRNTLALTSSVTGPLDRGAWYVSHKPTGRLVRWPGESVPSSWSNNRSAVLAGFDYARELSTESGDAYELITGAEVVEAFGRPREVPSAAAQRADRLKARNAELDKANQRIADRHRQDAAPEARRDDPRGRHRLGVRRDPRAVETRVSDTPATGTHWKATRTTTASRTTQRRSNPWPGGM